MASVFAARGALEHPPPPVNGVHILADMWGCDVALLDNVDFLQALVRDAAAEGYAVVLGVQAHKFSPHGCTAIALLGESHLSIHTWPEQGYAAVDVFTCGLTVAPQACIDTITAALGASDCVQQVVARGATTT